MAGLVSFLQATLSACNGTNTHQLTPWTAGVSITLRLPSTSTVWMIHCVHGKTSNRWPDAQPPLAARFPQPSSVTIDVAGHANRRTTFPVDSSDLTRLELHINEFCPFWVSLICAHNGCVTACAPADLRRSSLLHPNIEDRSSSRYHVQWHAIARGNSFCCKQSSFSASP